MKLGVIKKTVVAVVVATAASGGMTGAAFASKNTHKYQTSGEAQRQGIQGGTIDPCEGIWGEFSNDVKQAGIADQNKQTTARDNWLTLAETALEAGQKAGCDWATSARVPTYPTTALQHVHNVDHVATIPVATLQ